MNKVVKPRDIQPVSEQAEASVAEDTGRDESCGHILNMEINLSPEQLGKEKSEGSDIWSKVNDIILKDKKEAKKAQQK